MSVYKETQQHIRPASSVNSLEMILLKGIPEKFKTNNDITKGCLMIRSFALRRHRSASGSTNEVCE